MRLMFVGLLWSSLLLLWSCGESYHTVAEISPNNSEWRYQDSLVVALNIEDNTLPYHLYLDLTHSPEFAFQNLYVLISTTFPSGKRVADKVSLELADELGQWHGKCDDESCLLRVFLQENIYFEATGQHQIVVEQFMRQDSLSGVQHIAFRMAEAK
ncbi:MAG: gliding motility lipoprotein GldH [Bacteroidota bacterium]